MSSTGNTGLCAFCLDPCSLSCANCKKVSYCSTNHQKFDRRVHKPICQPVKLEWNQSMGNHLITTRDILPGEIIWEEKPIVIGPRSNLPKSTQVCLGCCNRVSPTNPYECPACHWPMCRPPCHQNPWHLKYECKIFESNRVSPPSEEDEFLFVTILRCVLIKVQNETLWNKFAEFEFHGDIIKHHKQGLEKILAASHFVLNRCNQSSVDADDIKRIYGILTVNGYSDASKFYVKLYELGSKISHSCLPNTRSMSKTSLETEENVLNMDSKLTVVATLPIQAGEVLTQLYGNVLTGTHRRQELFQNMYCFTCTCSRCQDPSELKTNFSGIFCQTRKCRRNGKFVLPEKPLSLSSHWTCAECNKKWNYNSLVFPALKRVAEATQMTVDDPFFSELEIYSNDETGSPIANSETISMKVDYVMKMDATIKKLGEEVVHPNHYALLPIKTALIATIHSIIGNDKDSPLPIANSGNASKVKEQQQLLRILLKNARNVLFLFDSLSPGMTRNRGIILFYLARGLKLMQQLEPESSTTEITEFWNEADRILKLEPKFDEFRQLVEKFA